MKILLCFIVFCAIFSQTLGLPTGGSETQSDVTDGMCVTLYVIEKLDCAGYCNVKKCV